jgi:hypothetical protein
MCTESIRRRDIQPIIFYLRNNKQHVYCSEGVSVTDGLLSPGYDYFKNDKQINNPDTKKCKTHLEVQKHQSFFTPSAR